MTERNIRILFVLLSLFFSASAHLDKNSLSLTGGETFSAGEKVTITWRIAVFHNSQHIIYFSADSGKLWRKIDSLPEKQGLMNMSYTWIAPDTVTNKARIRIFQSFVSSPGSETNDYTIVSKTFSITKAITLVRTQTSGARQLPLASVRSETAYSLQGRVVKGAVLQKLKQWFPQSKMIIHW